VRHKCPQPKAVEADVGRGSTGAGTAGLTKEDRVGTDPVEVEWAGARIAGEGVDFG
jgi:hypothetical protein